MNTREAIAIELAGHFAARPWNEMAEERADLKAKVRYSPPFVHPFDINEPTRGDCRLAADAVLFLIGGSDAE